MAHIILGDRSLVAFSGPDAEHLLHNVVTCNVEALVAGVAQIGALLTPQGKIMFDFLVSRNENDDFIVEIAKENAPAFMQKMIMYRLRSKVEISESSESFVRISWSDESSSSNKGLRDTRFSKNVVMREYLDAGTITDRSEWDQLRIDNGVPESGRDYALGDAFPHDVSLDQNHGVDFQKGCYIGQEVVSRMHHRHTARRRLLIATCEGELDTEAAITSGGKALGTVGTVVGNQALALCRIDRVEDATKSGSPILAGKAPITLTIPPNVTYVWPSEASNG
ncbi:MAG: folate-binding protein [Pseudomonadota bacterium]